MILEDLIVVAHEDARKKAERLVEEKMKDVDRRPFAAARYEAAVLMVLRVKGFAAMAERVAGPRSSGSFNCWRACRGSDRARRGAPRCISSASARSFWRRSPSALKVAREKIVTCRDLRQYRYLRSLHALPATSGAIRSTLIVVETVADLWALERAASSERALSCARRHLVAARRHRPEGFESRKPCRAGSRTITSRK